MIPLPEARRDDLIVRAVGDEVVVYDLSRVRAHRLNRVTTFIWSHCNGRTSVARLADLLAEAFAAPRNEGLVHLALDQLGRARLLRGERPAADRLRLSRRQAIALGLAGVATSLLPSCQSVDAPAPTRSQPNASLSPGAAKATSPIANAVACDTVNQMVQVDHQAFVCVAGNAECPALTDKEKQDLVTKWRRLAGILCKAEGECTEPERCVPDPRVNPGFQTFTQTDRRLCPGEEKPKACFTVIVGLAFCNCELFA